jgi:hypothetical protein
VNEMTVKWPEFLKAVFPQVILEMRGCRDVFVNEAHSRVFGEKDFSVVRSLGTARSRLSEAKRTRKHRTNRRKCEACYCEKVGAVFALRPPFCVFETSFLNLKQPHRETQGLGYFQVERKNGARSYKIFRVYSSKVWSQDRKTLMHCTVVPLSGLSAQVLRIGPLGSLPPRFLKCSAFLNGKSWLEEEQFEIPSDVGYIEFDKALQLALKLLNEGKKELSSIKQIVLQKIRARSNDIDYDPRISGHKGTSF